MYNVKDFGAKGDGKTVDSVAIQRAIDACAGAGGGTVVVPEGRYVCGTMHIKSHVHVHIEKGAFVLGSTNVLDFDPLEENPSNNLYQDRSHSYFHHSLFHADSAEDIALTGFGVIDMQSVWEVEEKWVRACKIVAFKNCKDVVIKGLTMLNATDLAVYFAGCENVLVTELNLRVHIDGISPDSCKNVIISNCIVDAGDDGIVPKSSYTLGKFKYMENLTISNCIVKSFCSGIKFGTESNTGFVNVTVTGCAIYNTRISAIALEAIDGAVVEGFSISNITMRNVGNPLMLLVLDRARGPEGTKIGEIKNISISNVTITGPYDEWEGMSPNFDFFSKHGTTSPAKGFSYPFIIVGQKDSIIKNVALSNVQFTAPGGGTEEDRNVVLPDVRDGYPECTRFGPVTPAYGMIAMNVENLKLYNVEFFTEKEDARDAIYLQNVTRYKNV